MIQKRCNVLVALTTNITNVEMRFFHVFSHMDFKLNFVKELVSTEIAHESSKLHLNMSVVFHMGE